jgi:tetratricopeptide (TPR) repeat protein
MNFFKALFGGKDENPEEKRQAEEAKNFEILKYDGVKALKIRQWQQAIRCLNHALSIREDLECRDYLSQALIQDNQLTAAYEELQKLHEAEPDNQEILQRMANVAFVMEDYGAMASSCEKALLISKDNPEIYYLYGRACMGQEDLTNAIAMFTKAISLNEDYGDAYLMRAGVMLQRGEVEAAEQDCQWLLERASSVEDVLILKAKVETAKGNHSEALSYYDKVIEGNPFSIEGFTLRAELKKQMGDLQGAEEDLARLREINPEGNDEDLEQKMNEAYKNSNPMGL